MSVTNHGCEYLTSDISYSGQNFTFNLTRQEFDHAQQTSESRICHDATSYGVPGCDACVDLSALRWTDEAITGCPRAQLWCGPFKIEDQQLGECLDFQGCKATTTTSCPNNCSYPAGQCVDVDDSNGNRTTSCRCIDNDHFDNDCSAVFDPVTSCVHSPKLLDLPLCLAFDFVSCDEVELQVTLAGVSVVDDTFNASSGEPTVHCSTVQSSCELCVTTVVTPIEAGEAAGRSARICNAINSTCLGATNFTCSVQDLTNLCNPPVDPNQPPEQTCPGSNSAAQPAVTCSGHGTCVTTTPTYECHCDDGYFGDDCSYYQDDSCLYSSASAPLCAFASPVPSYDCALLRFSLASSQSPSSSTMLFADYPIALLLGGHVFSMCFNASSSLCPFCSYVSAAQPHPSNSNNNNNNETPVNDNDGFNSTTTTQQGLLLLNWTVESACVANHRFDFQIAYQQPFECDDSVCSTNSTFLLTDELQRFELSSSHRVFGQCQIDESSAAVLRLLFEQPPPDDLEIHYAFDCQPRPSTALVPRSSAPREETIFDQCPAVDDVQDNRTIFLSLHCISPPCSTAFRTELVDVVDMSTTPGSVFSFNSSGRPTVQLLRFDEPFLVLGAHLVITVQASYANITALPDPKPWPSFSTSSTTCPASQATEILLPRRIEGNTASFVFRGNSSATPTYLRISVADDTYTALRVSYVVVQPETSYISIIVVSVIFGALFLLFGGLFALWLHLRNRKPPVPDYVVLTPDRDSD